MVAHSAAPLRTPGLREYQLRVAGALLFGIVERRAPSFTVMFPRQAGKNEVSAVVVAALLRIYSQLGGSIIVCAPTLTPQAAISLDRTWRAAATLARLFAPGARITTEGNRLLAGRASATFLSASPEAHVAGHTASIALIADEAQDIDAAWFDRQFRPMAASTAAPTVMFGTPWDGHTMLEAAVAANREADAARPGKPYDDFVPRHHQVSWEDVAESLPVYGDYVRSERSRLGPRHPLFLTQYEVRATDAAGRLLRDELLTAIEGSHSRLAAPAEGERYVAGLDFAGEGATADATVLTIARTAGDRCEVVHHLAWQSQSFARLIDELRSVLARWRPVRVVADATGMGGPLCAQLAPVLGDSLEPFTFTAASKSELGYALVAAAGTGRLALYAHDGSSEAAACRHELRSCRAHHAAGGQIRWEAPGGAHDDYVASLALCLRAASNAPPERVARGRR
jgi:hypothetical protein